MATIYTNPRDIGVDGNQVTISPATYERLQASELVCYELLSAIKHEQRTLVPQLVLDALNDWASLAGEEAGDGD